MVAKESRRPAFRNPLLHTLTAAGTLWLASCTAVTDPSDDDIRCVLRPDGSDPCLEITRICRAGRCVLPTIDAGTL